ncbi:MAG TPA: SDR family oxidoreductase [Gemmatimonadaceae bacterium]|nr:SDR family oxidoreductase [Gemmatimonadaceae bacterium]
MSLSGRTALVTGASRGIGAATVELLRASGAQVLAVSRSGQPSVDLSRPFVIESLVPDFLVNVAGAFALAPIDETDPKTFDDMMALNVGAVFKLIHAFLPKMRERGSGHIVTVGSIADHVAFPDNGAYAASKYAVRGLHEVLREELRGSPIRATLISPAAVDTPIWDNIEERPGLPPKSAMLKPAAVADAILYALTRPEGVSVDEIRLSHT